MQLADRDKGASRAVVIVSVIVRVRSDVGVDGARDGLVSSPRLMLIDHRARLLSWPIRAAAAD